jgi:AraC-like DNA-binding protein
MISGTHAVRTGTDPVVSMPKGFSSILNYEPKRWLQELLSPGTALSFPFAAFVSKRATPYVTGRRVLDVHLVWLIQKGSFPIRIQNMTVELNAGTLMWIPPGLEHETVVPCDVAQYGLRILLMRGRRSLGLSSDPMVIQRCGALAPLFDQIIAEHLRPGSYSALRQRGLLTALGAAVFARTDEPASVVGSLSIDHRVRLARLVREHRNHPSVGSLARALGLSADYFTRAFRRSFGMPPRQWLVRERLAEARLALANGETIKRVAHQFGYRDPHLFSRQFRKAYGLSPRQWRSSSDRVL